MSAGSMNDYASKSLGSENSYAIYTDKFDPSLLNPMPRSAARGDWGISGDDFIGYDVWHCHESTFLLENGLPIAGTLKIVCPASSEFMVESKSFKLYLNSFDMCKLGSTIEEAVSNYENQVTKDISECIGAEVKVKFFGSGDDKLYEKDPAEDYRDLFSVLSTGELQNMEITDYNAQGTYNIVSDNSQIGEVSKLFTNVLRSRCRHTKQKDTGAAYFKIITKRGTVNPKELLKLVVSLREVNEFHEFCCEKLYTEIMKHPLVHECSVMLLYARRGSLDINPARASNPSLLSTALKSEEFFTKKAQGQ
jgi:7-cyano-7-deazaguanine reductase